MPWKPRHPSSAELELQRKCHASQMQLLARNSELQLKVLYAN
jgi:hypothetical protein